MDRFLAFADLLQGLTKLAVALIVLGGIGYAAWSFWGPDAPKSLSVTVADDMPADSRQRVSDALDALLELCPGILEASEDITSVRAVMSPGPQAGAERYGWTRLVVLSFTFDDEVTRIPLRYTDPDLIYAGHTVRFLMGGGDKPGVIVEKPQAATLCEAPYTDGRNLHIPDPAMAAIDG